MGILGIEKKPLNVLQVVATSALGGMQEVVCLYIKDQLRHGMTVTAATSPGGPLVEKFHELGITTLEIDLKGRLKPTTITALYRFMAHNGIDIAHAHGTRATFYTYLASRMHRGTKLIGHVHSFNHWRYSGSWESYLDRVVSKRVDRLVTCSEPLRTSLLEQQGLSPGNTVAIPNGIDLSRFESLPTQEEARFRLGLPANALLAGTCTRLTRKKGINYLIESMALLADQLPHLHLAIAGDGKPKAALQRQAAEAGLANRIHWLGYRSDIPTVLAALDLFVLPSLVEGLPLVVLEAMAAGIPVVATAVSGIPEIVIPGTTGLLVEAGSAPALAEAIREMIDKPDLRRYFTTTAQRRVRERYSAEVMTQKVRELYAELCDGSQ